MILPRYALFGAMLAAAGLPIYIHAPKFFVDEYGVGLAEIGALLVALRLIDVVQDPLLGRLAARIPSPMRPLVAALGAAGMAAGMVGLFAVRPPIAPLWWMALCLVLLFTAFSFLTILFYARGVGQARDMGADGHVRLAGWRETGALLGISLATIAPFLLFGGGTSGFAAFALAFAVLSVVATLAMGPVWDGRFGRIAGGFGNLLQDRQIRRLLLIALVNAAPVAVTSTLFLFFVEYRIGSPQLAGPLLLSFFVAAAVAAPLWAALARRTALVPALTAGMALSILAFGWALFLETGDLLAFAAICIASGAALGADMTLLPALFATRVAEIESGEAEAFGLWNFAAKLTLALAAATVLPLLEWGGFVAGQENTSAALWRLSLLYAGLPCLLKLLALYQLMRLNQEETLTCSTP